MKIKVYNQNGKVKVTKTMTHKELVMVSNIGDGEMAEIEIDVTPCTTATHKRINSSSKEKLGKGGGTSEI